MHIALLANTAWLDEELAGLKHLVVGLIDEQVQVTQILPQQLDADEPSVFTSRLTWNESSLRLINHHRLRQLEEPLAEADVDLIHVLDGRLWQVGAHLAHRLDLPLVLSANDQRDVREAERLNGRVDAQRVVFTAVTAPIGQALRGCLPQGVAVEDLPIGLYPTARQPRPVKAEGPLCAVVSGNGVHDSRYQALLEGIAQLVDVHPQMQFFFDGQDADQHQIWKAASRLEVLANLSLVPRRLGHRELLLRADVLLHPQPLGKGRSLTLQAMAHGIPVIAHADDWLDYLLDDQTAWLLRDASATTWARLLARLIEQPQAARELGQQAQDWIAQRYAVSRQIEHVLQIYHRLAGRSVVFPGQVNR